MGGFYYRFTSVIEATTSRKGEVLISSKTKFHIFDRYNWDRDEGKSKSVTFPFKDPRTGKDIEIKDKVLGELHKAGVAKEFNLIGSSSEIFKRWVI